MRILHCLPKSLCLLSRQHPGLCIQPSRNLNAKLTKYLENKFERLYGSNSSSLLAKHLNDVVFCHLQHSETPTYKSNFLDCFRSGLLHYDSVVGGYASDPEAYCVFRELFNPIINDLQEFGPKNKQKKQEFGKLEVFTDIDPYQHYIYSTRIRVVRNLEAYPFVPKMKRNHFDEMEEGLDYVFKRLPKEFKGFYVPLGDIFKAKKERFIAEHMYRRSDRFMRDANLSNLYPRGRAIYYTIDKKFILVINQEDHLKIISMEQGGNFHSAYARLQKALKIVQRHYSFHTDEHLGNLTCCPTNLGTGIRASILIKLVKFPRHKEKFKKFLQKYDLQVRGTYGYLSPLIDNVYDISNRRTLGLNEYEIVRNVYEGAIELIRLERCAKVCN